MTTKKKMILIIACCMVVIIGLSVFLGVYFSKPASFKRNIKASGAYENTLEDALPQTVLHDIMLKHMTENTSGKTPKLLFIGYDGCLANAVADCKDDENSAVFHVAATGGLYLSYAGGKESGDQATSTAPGWASIFTGKWATEHGVKDNDDTLNETTRSLLYALPAKGLSTSFNYSWEPHGTVTYVKEIETATGSDLPANYNKCVSDAATFLTMVRSIEADTDATFGLLEYCDHAGHSYGFDKDKNTYKEAMLSSETAAKQLIETVETRETYAEEDWLIVITTDHGGNNTWHGRTSIMERTTFFAVSKPLV